MKRAITVALGCTIAVLLPASVAVAGDGNGGKSLAAKACTAEKKGLKEELGNKEGKAAFRAIHGKQAMRNCIKGTSSEIEEEELNASQECRTDQEADPEGFLEEWGTNTPKGEKSKGASKNAFGKCVSSNVKDEVEDDVEDTLNAAQQCRTDQEADAVGFLEEWGTNAPKGEKSKGANRNAFGKCVSATARAADDEEETPTG